jgi:hypothetical protein
MNYLFLLAIITAIGVALDARRKGYNPLLWLVPGAGIIGYLVEFFLPDIKSPDRSEERNTFLRRRGNIIGASFSIVLLAASVTYYGLYIAPFTNAHSTGQTRLRFEVRRAEKTFAQGLQPVIQHLHISGYDYPETVFVYKDIELDNRQIQDAAPKQEYYSTWVEVRLTQEGSDRLANITATHVGKMLAIFLEDSIVSTPIVQMKVTAGRISFPVANDKLADSIASRLKR